MIMLDIHSSGFSKKRFKTHTVEKNLQAVSLKTEDLEKLNKTEEGTQYNIAVSLAEAVSRQGIN